MRRGVYNVIAAVTILPEDPRAVSESVSRTLTLTLPLYYCVAVWDSPQY